MDLVERAGSDRRHPWEVERWGFFRSLMIDHGALDSSRVLDVGSGDGWFAGNVAELFAGRGEVWSWDTGYSPADLVDGPTGTHRTVDGPDGTFDLVLMMDVLEHIEDPVTFLRTEIEPRLRPGGLVLASVPAHPILFDAHDIALSHFRRYRRREFVEQISLVCTVERHGPLFVGLGVARAAIVGVGRLRRRFDAADDDRPDPAATGVGRWSGGPVVTRCVSAVLRVDAWACRRLFSDPDRRVPGLSHWAIGRR